jgi:hypothetical protein
MSSAHRHAMRRPLCGCHGSVSQSHGEGRGRRQLCVAGGAARQIAESFPFHVQKSAAFGDKGHIGRDISARIVERMER